MVLPAGDRGALELAEACELGFRGSLGEPERLMGAGATR
jgi:hypothetical protein